jgi:hypothetical protein
MQGTIEILVPVMSCTKRDGIVTFIYCAAGGGIARSDTSHYRVDSKGKDKVHPRTDHEGPEEE